MRISRRAALVASSATLLTACGGGDSVMMTSPREQPLTPGTGGTGGPLDEGEVDGWGSVMLGGLRIDDASASLQIEGGDSLELGMVVTCERVANAVAPTALSFRARPILVGPVSSLNAALATASVNGVAISTLASTAWAGAAGIASLSEADWVSVYGHVSASGVLATRVTKLDAPLPERAVVGALDRSGLGGGTVRVGGHAIGWNGGDASLPAQGTVVRAKFTVLRQTSTSTEIEALAADVADGRTVMRQGIVIGNNLQNFDLNGQSVSVQTGASVNTSTGAFAIGARVQVSGQMRNKVLRATSITVMAPTVYQAIGPIASRLGNSLRVQRQAVQLNANTAYINGSVADVANGKKVTVRGSTVSNGVLQADSLELN